MTEQIYPTPISGYYLKENNWLKDGFKWTKDNDVLTYDGSIWLLNDKEVKYAHELFPPHQHEFVPSEKKDYEICLSCGTYHSTAQLPPSEIYESDYWSHEQNRSTLEEQVHNHTETDSAGISKIDKILSFVDPAPAVLEIAPAPGVLMKKLSEGGYAVFGVEPNPNYAEQILAVAPRAHLFIGYYPDIFAPSPGEIFNYIIGMDVVEHIEDYKKLFSETYRLLKPGGKFIFMSPILYGKDQYRDCDFDHPDEHCWLYTKEFLEQYLLSMFSSVEFNQWILGHEIVICKK
jgi:SAM-dependent methyltransferase